MQKLVQKLKDHIKEQGCGVNGNHITHFLDFLDPIGNHNWVYDLSVEM